MENYEVGEWDNENRFLMIGNDDWQLAGDNDGWYLKEISTGKPWGWLRRGKPAFGDIDLHRWAQFSRWNGCTPSSTDIAYTKAASGPYHILFGTFSYHHDFFAVMLLIYRLSMSIDQRYAEDCGRTSMTVSGALSV